MAGSAGNLEHASLDRACRSHARRSRRYRDQRPCRHRAAALLADDRKQRFRSLPYDLQIYVVSRETQREKALRRAQNEAAALRQKLATLQPLQTIREQKDTDETDPRATS